MKDITLAVHAGSRKDDVNGAINQPINTTSKQSRPSGRPCFSLYLSVFEQLHHLAGEGVVEFLGLNLIPGGPGGLLQLVFVDADGIVTVHFAEETC